MSHYPVFAKGPISHGSSDVGPSMSTGSDEATLPPGIGPEAAVEQILAFLGKDEYLTARRLAREAARRFPDHARVRKIAGVFDPRGKAVVRPGGPRQPDRSREFEWLRHPPDWAHGKWVALDDSFLALLDTRGHYCIFHPDIAHRLRDRLTDPLTSAGLHTARGLIRGDRRGPPPAGRR